MIFETQLTVAEFDQLVLLPENRDKLLEYIGGKIVEVVSNNKSSVIGSFLNHVLTAFALEHRSGYVSGADGGYRVNGERYIPDAAYVSKSRLPQPVSEGYVSIAPDVAVEVISPSNTATEIRLKVVNYLIAGTTVWVADPDQQTIEVYIPNKTPMLLGMKDVLDGGTVLPGFRLPVSDIFTFGGVADNPISF
jgi:Uma2 family endonuclease